MSQPFIRLVALIVAVSSMALAGAATTLADTSSTSSGTLTITSDPLDWVGQGQQFSFATPQNTMTAGGGLHGFGADVMDSNGSPNWSLRFGVPLGQTLAPGVYSNAQLFEDQTHPRIDIAGEHRGCGTGTFGSFRVLAAEFGP